MVSIGGMFKHPYLSVLPDCCFKTDKTLTLFFEGLRLVLCSSENTSHTHVHIHHTGDRKWPCRLFSILMWGDSTFLISQLHYSLLTVVSGRRLKVVELMVEVFLSLVSQPAWFFFFFLYIFSPIEVAVTLAYKLSACEESAERSTERESKKIQIAKCKCSTILSRAVYCIVLPAPDSLLLLLLLPLRLHARHFD